MAPAIPPAATPRDQQPPIHLDTAGIDKALGRRGTAHGGIYKFTVAEKETNTDGHVLPPTFGVAINGDFAMTAPEVQKVIQAMREGAQRPAQDRPAAARHEHDGLGRHDLIGLPHKPQPSTSGNLVLPGHNKASLTWAFTRIGRLRRPSG
ncbi:DUF1259 domain-containing protein [Amycolatopsis acididurans]|uniref:DUF1259 domain-containing protein n=1 Tax=Amycolatopsis acididurans TaxID=2724524 RepID=UPI001FE30946|nr:DUF1259 domain-containing protein [Amycolatopsis acididurans]